MDINNFKTELADEGVSMQLLDPVTEEPIEGTTITLLGQDSAKYEKMTLRRSQAVLNRISKGKKGVDLKAEEVRDNSIDDLVELTVDWTGFEENGKPLKCTPKTSRKIYTEIKWIREQALEFVADRSNFFRKP